ncbi:TonB-dependent receptor [Rhodospira trueperi]|uniref:Iron complex outermembrane recepter protein n=1 Tax=Rhodospira trueperi TaxID=69960 RepID=A0A1G7DJC6_9PROT|nr:TonB-dependent receptor [Rhodospira trueperi]SDE51150.1 iron complex outermembrane recepter protein [Rhodospira trueperi]
MGPRDLRRSLLTTCACVALSMPAAAQDATDEEADAPTVLSPIEVTAQFRSEDPLDVPISMDVVDRFEIEDRGQKDLSDTLNAVPNVVLQESNGQVGFSTITMRGIGNQGGDMAGGDQAIGMYVDGVYIGAQVGMNPPLYDVERIEVLRGPQGTLYGRNAMGGAVNIITAEPEPELYLSGEAMYGSFDLYNLAAVANGAIGTFGDTTVSARLSANQAGRGATVDNSIGDDLGDYSTTSGRAQVRAAGSLYDVVLRADYTDQDATAYAYDDFDDAGDRDAAIAEPFEYELQNYGLSLNGEVYIGDLTLQSISAWRSTHTFADGNDWNASDSVYQSADWDQNQLSQEFRLTSPDDVRLRWVAGVFIFHNEEEERNVFSHRPGSSPLWGMFANGESEISNSETTTNSQAVFGDATYGVTDWLDVTVGLRVTHDTKETHYTHVSQMGMAPTQTLDYEFEALDFSPKFTVMVKPNDATRVYATISRGYKSGGYNRLFAPSPKLEFESEHVWNYELGAKLRLFDDRMELNGALFYTDWYDQQVTAWRGMYNEIANVPHSESYGAEVDVAARVTDTVTLGGAFGWTEATFLDFPNPSATIASGDGFRQPNAPRFTYALSAQYLGPLDDIVPIGSDVDLLMRADYTYRSSTYYDITNQLEEPGYGLLNLRAGVLGDGWRVEGFIKNATDEEYRVQATEYNGMDLAVAGDPRTFGLRVKVDL